MAASGRAYANFDLVVEAGDDGTYRARVAASPVGAGATAEFALPFTDTELENLLLKLDPGRSQMRRAAADPRPAASTRLGGALFDAAFGEEVLLAWTRSQDATSDPAEGLRLRLQLGDAPALAGLPWELLWDRRTHSFPAQSERTPVVRFLEVPQPPSPLVVDGPLHVLVVLSSPTDLPELDVEAEWRRLQDVLAPRVAAGTVVLDRLPEPTTAALAAWLRDHAVHVLHVVGHGDYDEQQQEGVLYLQDRYGRSVAVPPAVLGPYLHDHDPLRLVVLNACRSGRLGALDPFSGMAQRLVQQDCTAVVAMQFPISDGAATAFTGEFYAALADGLPVDQAVTSARKGLLSEYAGEWATPVLYLNAPDGRVFESVTPLTPLTPLTPVTPVPTNPSTPAAATAPPAPVGPPPARTGSSRGRLVAAAVGAGLVVAAAVGFAVTRGSAGTSGSPGTSPPAVAADDAAAGAPAAPTPVSAPPVATPSVSLRPVEGPPLTAAQLATPPTIDGRGDDWPARAPVVADALVAGTTATVKGIGALGWDADRLYLFVQVIDPEVTTSNAGNPARLFQGDSVTLQLGSSGANADGSNLSPGDVSLAIGPDGAGGAVSAVTIGSGRGFDVDAGRAAPSVTAATTRTPNGWTVEAAIPWDVVNLPEAGGLRTAYAGAQFGANLVVSDADPAAGSATGIRSRVSNNRYVADHTASDGGYRRYWSLLTLGT